MTYPIHKALYSYCHELFINGLTQGEFVVSEEISNMSHRFPMLYQYPPSYENLIAKSGSDTQTLRKLGWLEPIFNQNFIIWYRRNGTIQLIPIDAEQNCLVKFKPLSNDLPFAYLFAKANNSPGTSIYILNSPLHAILLQDKGMSAISTGGAFVHKSHFTHLAVLDSEYVYIGTEKNLSAAESFCAKAGSIGLTARVCIVKNVDSLFGIDDVEQHLAEHSVDSLSFLLERIITKKRKSIGLSVTQEVISTAQILTENNRNTFVEMAEAQGIYTRNQERYLLACQMLTDLLKIDIPISEATSKVFKVFNVKITFSGDFSMKKEND